MVLRFETPVNNSGNKLQLIYNTDTNTIARGYYLFRWGDVVKVKNRRELETLYKMLVEGGAKVETD